MGISRILRTAKCYLSMGIARILRTAKWYLLMGTSKILQTANCYLSMGISRILRTTQATCLWTLQVSSEQPSYSSKGSSRQPSYLSSYGHFKEPPDSKLLVYGHFKERRLVEWVGKCSVGILPMLLGGWGRFLRWPACFRDMYVPLSCSACVKRQRLLHNRCYDKLWRWSAQYIAIQTIKNRKIEGYRQDEVSFWW